MEHPAVGAPITSREQFRALPPGTVITPHNDPESTFIKVDENAWTATNGVSYRNVDFPIDGTYLVLALPDGTPRQETLHQYRWRYRDNALAMTHAHGVSISAVMDGLRDLKVADLADFPFGTGLTITNLGDRDLLPAGSTVMIGQPGVVSTFAIFEKRGRTWERVFGERRGLSNSAATMVHTVAGAEVRQDWIEAEGTAADAQAIDDFKAQAWVVGARIKRSQSWCSTYDAVMRRVGVDATALNRRSVDGFRVGDVVSVHQAAMLPVGTVLRYLGSDGTQTWYLRVEESTNRAGTRRIMSTGPTTGHYADTMQVVAFAPDREGVVCALPPEMWNHLPLGSRIVVNANDVVYQMHADHRVREWYPGRHNYDPERPGVYALRDFDTNTSFYVVHFGGQ